MKQSQQNVYVVASAVVLLVALAARVPAVSAADGEWQPVLPWQGKSLNQVETYRVPSQYDLVLLALGRSVYADLQQARQAALDREVTNLRVAIREARDTVRRLQSPMEAKPLQEQLAIIRNDLRDSSKDLDEGMWVPVEAEIDATLVDVPEDVKARAHAAIHEARKAVAQADRQQVAEQLDIVTATMEYSLGVFPLGKVREDLDSAQASASLSPPDWTGTLEAVQSALASFHWYTQAPVHALLSAYSDAVNAYVLAAGPVIRDDQRWEIIGYLTRVKKELEGAPDSRALLDEVGKLIDTEEPQGKEIRLLLAHIQERMRIEQAQSVAQYWKTIGPDTPE